MFTRYGTEYMLKCCAWQIIVNVTPFEVDMVVQTNTGQRDSL